MQLVTHLRPGLELGVLARGRLAHAVPAYLIGHRVADDSVELVVLVGELIEVLAPEQRLCRTVVGLGSDEVLQQQKD